MSTKYYILQLRFKKKSIKKNSNRKYRNYKNKIAIVK